jgi:flagellar basal-body rod modification protein FlgD
MAVSSATATQNLPIDSLINNGTTSTAPSSTSTSASSANITSQLGPSACLSLLTTQLANQDPLNPMDDTQSVSQLAQFSALQASDNLETSFANFQSNFAVTQAASLIGQTVSVNSTDSSGNSSTLIGTVQAIQVVNGAPTFTLINPSTGSAYANSNGTPLTFTTSQITGIGGAGSAAGPSTTGSGSGTTGTGSSSTGSAVRSAVGTGG